MQALLAKLKELSLPHQPISHKAAMTVEEHAEALQGHAGSVTKNLFLKDKKGRLYIITALPDTKVDLKVLSARLGVGRGGIRMAPDELITSILQVPLGSVTPLAVSQPTAADVVLLLDIKLKSEASFFVHPLENTSSLPLNATELENFLKSLAREAMWVDLEADPKIDRDNPPDLKHISDAARPIVSNEDGAAAAPPAAAAAPSKKQDKKKDTKKTDADKASAAAARAAYDVYAITDSILAKVMPAAHAVESIDVDAMRKLKADIAMELNALKNASYSAGFKAAQQSVIASITGAHA